MKMGLLFLLSAFLASVQLVAALDFDSDYQYIGCYEDRSTRDLNLFKRIHDNTPKKCRAYCKEQGFKFSGVQYTDQCFCGNNYGSYSRQPDSECNARCPGDSNIACGGTWRNSIYATGIVDPAPQYSNQYIGCYEDRPSRDLGVFNRINDNRPQECQALCKEQGFRFAGVQYTNQCFCGNSYGTYALRPESECNARCPGDSRISCGGTWRNSIYATGLVDPVPLYSGQYLGCYEDKPERDLPEFHAFSDNTPQECQAHCRTQGFRYSGVQYTGQCFCGNSYGRYARQPDSECNARCPGDSELSCGGTWRNSIYATAEP